MLTSSLSTSNQRLPDQGRTLITIENVEKRFGTHSGDTVTALAQVNLDIKESEFVSVAGPSGCGKIARPRSLRTMASGRFGEICDQIRTIFGSEASTVASL
jgi:NitT/TauT family transport system ATP-binding protein